MKNFLPSNLKHLLVAHNMNAAQLAERLNVSPQAVGKWLNTNSDALPSLENLIIVSNIFGVTVDALLKTDLQNESVNLPESMPDKIDSAIMALERLKAELKKKERAIIMLLGKKARQHRHPSGMIHA